MLNKIPLHTYEYKCSVFKGIATVETFIVSDAGAEITPETADPEYRLARHCIKWFATIAPSAA